MGILSMNKLVRESISFQRGLDPKKALGVGMEQILTYPFIYELIPDGFYQVFNISRKNKLLGKMDSSPKSSCLCVKDGLKINIVGRWTHIYGGIAYTYLDSGQRIPGHEIINKNIVSVTHAYRADYWGKERFNDWVEKSHLCKMRILSEEEFKKLSIE